MLIGPGRRSGTHPAPLVKLHAQIGARLRTSGEARICFCCGGDLAESILLAELGGGAMVKHDARSSPSQQRPTQRAISPLVHAAPGGIQRGRSRGTTAGPLPDEAGGPSVPGGRRDSGSSIARPTRGSPPRGSRGGGVAGQPSKSSNLSTTTLSRALLQLMGGADGNVGSASVTKDGVAPVAGGQAICLPPRRQGGLWRICWGG